MRSPFRTVPPESINAPVRIATITTTLTTPVNCYQLKNNHNTVLPSTVLTHPRVRKMFILMAQIKIQTVSLPETFCSDWLVVSIVINNVFIDWAF